MKRANCTRLSSHPSGALNIYGLSSIAEHYNRHMAEAFEGLTGFRHDIVIFDKDVQTHADHVKQFLQHCQDRQISLNREKWKYCQPRVTFAGFQLSSEGYQIDPAITEAISKFPTPTNRSDLHSFFGLVNQLSSSTDTIAELLSSMCSLLH